MNDKEKAIVDEIKAALDAVVKKPVEITIETDLIEDGCLDSLDGMIFVLDLESRTGRKFPEDIDLVKEGFYKVRNLVKFLS